MRVYLPSIDRRNRNCTTSNSSNDDQNKKSSIEIIDIKVFTFHSNSDVTTFYFIE